MVEREKLKPCPFCGYEKIDIEKIDDIGTGLFMAICPRCSAKSGILENNKRVAEAWNRRSENKQCKHADICRLYAEPEG